MNWPVVFIVESDPDVRGSLAAAVREDRCDVVEMTEAATLRGVVERVPDLVILGMVSGSPARSVQLARDIRAVHRTLPILLVPSRSSEALAIAALRAGVTEYVRRPIDPSELSTALGRCLARRAPGGRGGPPPTPGGLMIGDTRVMRELRAYVEKVAASGSTVLITGETGTGKELVARLIHTGSARRDRPFLCVNCAAIPDSLLESELFGYERGAFTGATTTQRGKLAFADRGTVFLDEIGEMSPYAQAKLLRVLESGEILPLGSNRSVQTDVRVVAATNQDLEQLMARGRFRKDLYFRLSVVRVHLPPLRERRDDIPRLVAHHIADLNRRLDTTISGVSPPAMTALMQHGWPGNVRELKNLLEAIAVTHRDGEIPPTALPPPLRHLARGHGRVDPNGERERVLSALSLTNGNKCRAAQHLQWSRVTLYRKMAKYGIGPSVVAGHGGTPTGV